MCTETMSKVWHDNIGVNCVHFVTISLHRYIILLCLRFLAKAFNVYA